MNTCLIHLLLIGLLSALAHAEAPIITDEPNLKDKNAQKLAQIAVIAISPKTIEPKSYLDRVPRRLYYESQTKKNNHSQPYQILDIGHNRATNFHEVIAESTISLKRRAAPNISKYYRFLELPKQIEGSKTLYFISASPSLDTPKWSSAVIAFTHSINTNNPNKGLTIINLSRGPVKINGISLGAHKSAVIANQTHKTISVTSPQKERVIIQTRPANTPKFQKILVLHDTDPFTNRGRKLGYFIMETTAR